METKMLQYNLVVKGVFGRNRKVKTEVIKLARTLETVPLDEDKVLADALAWCRTIKLKPGAAVAMSRDPITVETDRGYEVVKYLLGSGKVLYRGHWEG